MILWGLWFVQSVPSGRWAVLWYLLPFAAVFWPHVCHHLASTRLRWPAVSYAPPQPGLTPSWSVPPPPCCSLPLWTRNEHNQYQNINSIVFLTSTMNKHSIYQNNGSKVTFSMHSGQEYTHLLYSMFFCPAFFHTSTLANVFTPLLNYPRHNCVKREIIWEIGICSLKFARWQRWYKGWKWNGSEYFAVYMQYSV